MPHHEDNGRVSVHEDPLWEIIIHSAEVGPPVGDFQPMRLLTSRGTVEARLHAVTRPIHAVVFAGGNCGGWDSPADGLFHRLGWELRERSVVGLRVCFRRPAVLEECVLDLLAAVAYLESEDIHSVGLVGHGFGGAVVLHAAAATPSARSVVTLGLQELGAGAEYDPPHCPLLAIHGGADDVTPPQVSEQLYHAAGGPKRLAIYPRAGHDLEEVAPQVHDLILEWILRNLRGGTRSAPGSFGRALRSY